MELERLAKALADQTRMRVMMLIVGQGELCVCELTDILAMAQPKISRHLAILRECGLLQTRKSGLWVYYSLDTQLPEWVKSALNNLYQGSQQQATYQQDAQQLGGAVSLQKPCC